jgi:hypothetical protein
MKISLHLSSQKTPVKRENPIFFVDSLAEVAHLVEHDLAKVGVAGSSPVFRSKNPSSIRRDFLLIVIENLFANLSS